MNRHILECREDQLSKHKAIEEALERTGEERALARTVEARQRKLIEGGDSPLRTVIYGKTEEVSPRDKWIG